MAASMVVEWDDGSSTDRHLLSIRYQQEDDR
jgi:hypothetical protein